MLLNCRLIQGKGYTHFSLILIMLVKGIFLCTKYCIYLIIMMEDRTYFGAYLPENILIYKTKSGTFCKKYILHI